MPVCSRIAGVNVCVRCGRPSECQSPLALGPTLGMGWELTGWHMTDSSGTCIYCGEEPTEEPESPGGIVWPPLDDDDDHHRPGVRTRWRSSVLKAPTWC